LLRVLQQNCRLLQLSYLTLTSKSQQIFYQSQSVIVPIWSDSRVNIFRQLAVNRPAVFLLLKIVFLQKSVKASYQNSIFRYECDCGCTRQSRHQGQFASLLAEGYSIKFILDSTVEAFADSICLWASGLSPTMINVF